MKIKFWGVRGSLPTPGRDTIEFGGNTPCIQVDTGSDIIILDAGTGIRDLGFELLKKGQPLKVHILITHTHWDHIMGLPFFVPIFLGTSEIHLYGPAHHDKGVEDIIKDMMDYEFFPVSAMSLAAKMVYHDLHEEKEEFNVNGTKINAHFMNHPVYMMGYRLEHEGKSVIYTGDHEPYYDMLTGDDATTDMLDSKEGVSEIVTMMNSRIVDFAKNSTLLICDTAYTKEEYDKKRGWGHSTYEQGLELASNAHIEQLALFHHDPSRKDKQLLEIESKMQSQLASQKPEFPKKVFAAREGMEITL